MVLENLQLIMDNLHKHFQPQFTASLKLKLERQKLLSTLEALQNHKSEKIYKLAFEIIDKYFNTEAEEEKMEIIE